MNATAERRPISAGLHQFLPSNQPPTIYSITINHFFGQLGLSKPSFFGSNVEANILQRTAHIIFSNAFSTSAAARILTMSRPLRALALLYLAGQALAHEHHTDEIPEGEAISAQPIVLAPSN